MKYIVIGDNHFCEKSSVISGRGKKYSHRIENQIKSLKWVSSFGLPVIHLGDFFDRSFLKAEEVQAFTDEIRPLILNKSNIFLLGNHEYSGSYDLLSPLGDRILRKPTKMCLSGRKVLFLPFNSKEEDIPDEEFDIIFGHIGIENIPFGAKGFNFDLIDSHCKVFLNGHLHNRYKFKENKWNIGSLTAQNFSDNCIDYLKGAVILDTETLELEFIINPFAFNFFKISWQDLLKRKDTPLWEAVSSENSCLSISGPEGCKTEIKEKGYFEKVYYLRVSEQIKPSTVINKVDETGLPVIDYVDKFRKSFIDRAGESKTVYEELAEVFK